MACQVLVFFVQSILRVDDFDPDSNGYIIKSKSKLITKYWEGPPNVFNPTAWDCGTCPHRNFRRFRKPCFVSGADAQRVPAQCHVMVDGCDRTLANVGNSNHPMAELCSILGFQRGGAAERWKLDAYKSTRGNGHME